MSCVVVLKGETDFLDKIETFDYKIDLANPWISGYDNNLNPYRNKLKASYYASY